MSSDWSAMEAAAQLENIRVLVRDYEASRGTLDEDETLETIQSGPLYAELCSGWYGVGKEGAVREYRIDLSSGGPATRIVGDFKDGPTSARLKHQNWSEPWREFPLSDADRETLLIFAECVLRT